VLGCAGDRLDCCPFTVPGGTDGGSGGGGSGGSGSGGTSPGSGPSGGPQPTQPPALVGGGFPSAAQNSQNAVSERVTQSRCPADYYSISSLCCPRNYIPYNMAVGDITPCFSSTSISKPPPITKILAGSQSSNISALLTASSSSSSSKPTFAVVNIVIALPYPVRDPPVLSTPAKIGVGVGSSVAGIILIILLALLALRYRKPKKKTGGSQPSETVAMQSSALLQGDRPTPRWARDIRPQSPPEERVTHPYGSDGDVESGEHGEVRRYGDGPQTRVPEPSENPFEDEIGLQGDLRYDPEFSSVQYSDTPRPL